MPGKRVSNDLQREAVRLYRSGLSTRQTAKMLCISASTVRKAVLHTGSLLRTGDETRRKYQVRIDAFDDLSEEGAAYWLGFIAADGCVRDRCIDINLCSIDLAHLHKFRVFMGSMHPIRDIIQHPTSFTPTTRFACNIKIHSAKLYEKMLSLGIPERKSLTLVPPHIPEIAERHFWRGCVDGDGFITKQVRKDRSHRLGWIIGLCGTEAMMRGFHAFVSKHIQSRATPRATPPIWRVSWGGIGLPQAVASLLYKDATVFLDRKKALVDEMLSVQPLHTRSEWSICRVS